MSSSNERPESVEADSAGVAPAGIAPSVILRTSGFFGFWLILTGADPADFAAGVVAAVAATWASMRLMPQQHWDARPLKIVGLVLRFLRQTIIAGADVAWRALDPRLPLRPGIITYYPLLPPGTKRNTFCAITSLMPGTLPSGAAKDGGIAIHCLDVTQPIAEQLATEETLFVEALGGEQSNG